jgi:predicted nucleic acid-binding protein
MLVADTSALVSLASVDLLPTVLTEFDVHTTEAVMAELERTAEYDDPSGEAARRVLQQREHLIVHTVDDLGFESSRIDAGEGSCAVLAQEAAVGFLLTDDLRALPELQSLVAVRVAISPIVLKALVKRGSITQCEARMKLEEMANARDWLEAPIYRIAQQLFEDESLDSE